VSEDAALFAAIAGLLARGAEGALVTVVRVSGSTPRAPGARMVVVTRDPSAPAARADTPRLLGTIGGGRVEHACVARALEVARGGSAALVELNLTQSLGMCCGGTMTVFVEPMTPSPHLLVLGAGHVGRALASAARAAGFRVSVADERLDQLADVEPGVERIDHLDVATLPIDAASFVMVTTHDHGLDQRLVELLLPRGPRWIGLIGSRRKAAMTRERLEAKGFAAERIAALRCPVGLAIGAETPAEIAVAIVAELVAVRREASLPAAALDPKTT
jgi:xanthine dehydrogenase accessory factor